MGKIISIANQKGGVGKTTTAINLSAALALKGMKVLTIDCDPQGNTTSGLGIDKNKLDMTLYQMIVGSIVTDEDEEEKVDIKDCIHESVIKNLFVLPSDINLAAAEIELIGVDESNYLFKNSIEPIKDEYDYIIIDCPPSLNILTVNAMTCSDSVIVPIQCEFYALEGLSQLLYTIDRVKTRLNPDLEVDGVVFTMYDARTNLSLQVVESVRANLHKNIFNSIIPRNVRLAEAPSHGLPICLYDPKSAGAEAYNDLADEVLEHDKKGVQVIRHKGNAKEEKKSKFGIFKKK